MLSGCRLWFDPLGDDATGDASTFDASDGASVDAAAGPNGNVLHMDGVDDYAAFDSVCSSLTSSFTIEGWVRPAAVQSATSSVVPFATNTTIGGNGFIALWDHTTTQFKYYDDVYTMRMVNTTNVLGDQWHFMAVSFTPGHALLYSDGDVYSDVQTPLTITSPCLVSLGQEFDGLGNPTDNMDGYFDEVSVWSVAKSAAEIVADMNANIAGSEPGLVAYYRFESDGSDSSGNGNTMTFLGGAAIVAQP
jgi:hypothetical protein